MANDGKILQIGGDGARDVCSRNLFEGLPSHTECALLQHSQLKYGGNHSCRTRMLVSIDQTVAPKTMRLARARVSMWWIFE